MEQIVVELSPFTRRRRSLGVSHREQGLLAGLVPGEHVVVHDTLADAHFTAVVKDVEFELDDTVYRLALGGQITAGEADAYLAPTGADDHLTTADIVALLAELRRNEQDMTSALATLRVH